MAVDLAHVFGLPPEKAMEYFRSKGMRETWDWHEMWQDAHSRAFTVAKATKGGVLESIRAAVDKALNEGQTLEQFQRGLAPTLKTLGWWGRVPDPNNPEQTVQLGSPWRMRTIYRTNLATAEAAGRWRAFEDNATDRPYLEYIAVMDAVTRPAHAALHGKVFRIDDPFWDSFMPPNDWGCRCRVRALSADEVKERGHKVEDGAEHLSSRLESFNSDGEARPVGVYRNGKTHVATGRGWNYNPGKLPDASFNAWDSVKTAPPEVVESLMADMQSDTMVKAREVRARNFIERGALSKETAAHTTDLLEIGWIDPRDFKTLQAAGLSLDNPLLVTDRRGATHSTRADKGSAVKDLVDIPELIVKASAVLHDLEDDALLFIYPGSKEGMRGKVVVKLGRKARGVARPLNVLATTGEVPRADLAGNKRYKLIRGEL